MKKPSEEESTRAKLRESIIGLGERSIRKSYYPELQQRISELEQTNAELSIEIAERKKSEMALHNKESYFRALFENAGDAIFIEDENNRIRDVNNKACDLLGYTREELLKMRVIDVQPVEYRKLKKGAGKKLPRSHKIPFETVDLTKDGKSVPVEVTTVHLTTGDDNLVVSIVRDITERKQAEAEKEKLQSQLIQSQKMESVGRLAGGVAHDYNNMLGVILGHSDLAIIKAGEHPSLLDHLKEIHKAAQRSAELTQQLLAFARRQTIAPKVLDLNAAITATLQMLRLLINENIELDWLPGPDIYPVKIDPSQFDQLLMNLCINARDAISETGRICIETRKMTVDETYRRTKTFFVPGDYAVLIVSDNGSGMEKEIQAKIFEPFFTTKNMGQGTGLGLATVYGIVKQNNGFINVYSEPGHGTTFSIYLPLHSGLAIPTPKIAAEKISSIKNKTILVVEDERDLLEICKTMLWDLGYNVLAASTPEEAIKLAVEFAGEIDLLITDVVMPGMNGRELQAHIQKSNAEMKCLFMSGYTSNVISHHGVLDEGVYFIQKPFSLKGIDKKIIETLNKRI
ncbi:MAG: PAS domain S-box protein [Desulforhopalus sp.]